MKVIGSEKISEVSPSYFRVISVKSCPNIPMPTFMNCHEAIGDPFKIQFCMNQGMQIVKNPSKYQNIYALLLEIKNHI